MKKRPFVTKEQLEAITQQYPTPFHIYDEAGIRKNAERLKQAFAWNPGFREYFAVKATPNPYILNILKEYDCGTDCSSMTELNLTVGQAAGILRSWAYFAAQDSSLAKPLEPVLELCAQRIVKACSLDGEKVLSSEPKAKNTIYGNIAERNTVLR